MKGKFKMSSRLTNLPKLQVFQQNVTVAGTAEQLAVKIRAATIAFNNNIGVSDGDSITDSANGFLIAGFRVGDNLTISGAVNTGNNASFVIKAVTAGVITLNKTNVLTTEVAGNTIKIVSPQPVTEGIEVTIKAKYANTGNIYLGFSAESAKSTGFTLRNNESVGLQLASTDIVWIDAAVSGEGVEVIFESGIQAGE